MGGRNRRIARAVLSALAVLAIAFCAWSMSQYARGEDPLASLPGAPSLSLSTTQEASDAASGTKGPGTGSEVGAKEGPTSPSNEQSPSGSAGEPGGDSGSAGSPSSRGEAAGGSEGEGRASEEGGLASGTGVSTASGGPADSDDGLISVTVLVNGSSSTAHVSEGSTAYDALRSVASVQSGANPYGSGSWVYVINGVGSTDMSGGHGWVYSVDGVSPSVMSDEYGVSDGSVVSWSYV